MRKARLLALALMSLACAALAWGCGKRPLPLTPVTGKVTYRGFALPSGTIVFAPDTQKGESGPLAHGRIREDGSFSLYTGDTYGATPGWYRVTVLSIGSSLPGEPYATPQSVLPDKYRDPDLSLLSREVLPHKSNHIDFILD